MVSDNSIIERLHRRDESALEEIRGQYGAICWQIAYRILENREDADECVNDMLMAVWESIPPQLPVSLQAYLITLVRRAALDKYRLAHRQKRGGGQMEAALDELEEILPADTSVEHDVEQRELTRAIQGFLDTLRPNVRNIFMQRYFLAVSVQAIADAHHMSQSAVKMTLHRTRKKLQDYLRKEGLL